MKKENLGQTILSEINGKEFLSYKQLISQGIIPVFSSHMGKMPFRYTYRDFFAWVASNGWVRKIDNDKFRIQIEVPELDQLRNRLRQRITTPIEEEIFPVMVFVEGLGFTVQDGGWRRELAFTKINQAPFVDISEGPNAYDTKQNLWRLLINFYKSHNTAFVNSLVISYFDYSGSYLIESIGGQLIRLGDQEYIDKKFDFETEMIQFTQFIKQRYMKTLPGYALKE